jgi:hypothetical protein
MINAELSAHTREGGLATDRSFGLVFTGFFLVVGLIPLLDGQGIRLWALGVSALFLLLSLTVPRVLAPANRAWAKFGQLLHGIVSPVALGILFFGVVTPTGVVMRLLGKDPLRLRLDRSTNSYWIVRTPPGPDAESLKNQF